MFAVCQRPIPIVAELGTASITVRELVACEQILDRTPILHRLDDIAMFYVRLTAQ